MSKIAREKLAKIDCSQIEFQISAAEDCDLPPAKFDLILCINSLYAMRDPKGALRRIRDGLCADGYAFIIDFGRVQNTLDWTTFLLLESVKQGRLIEYLRSLLIGREVLRQNRLTRAGQETGAYWLHTTEEFKVILEGAGLNVREMGTCYRGYCDYAVVDLG